MRMTTITTLLELQMYHGFDTTPGRSNTSDSGRFKKVVQIVLVNVPNKSAIAEHSKNMHINGVYL